MLQSFHHYLETLYEGQRDQFRANVARHCDGQDLDAAVQDARDFVLALPAVLSCLTDIILHQDAPMMGRMLVGSVSAYLFRPKDFIPEKEYGFYGFLDDAYLATYALCILMTHVEPSVRNDILTQQLEQIYHQIALMERVERIMPQDVLFLLKDFLKRVHDNANIIAGQVELWMPLP